MDFEQSVRLSWRSITDHRLRTTLTTLGLVIGIGSVIVFMVMGSGFVADALADVDDETDPTVTVQTQTDAEAGLGWQVGMSPTVTEHDVEQLAAIDGVEYVAPDGWLSPSQASVGNRQVTGMLNARTTVPAAITGNDLAGDPFEMGADEGVVNPELREAFQGALSIGDELTLRFDDGRTKTVTVTGIFDDGDGGWNAQPTVYLPTDPYHTIEVDSPRGTTEKAYPMVEIRATNAQRVPMVQESARSYLEAESDASHLLREGYELRALSQEEQIERFESLIDQITTFVATVAGIALVVGSIGIANVMIVSVTERTRQIGIMKAVGATKRDILQLFLLEAVLLGLIGSFIGVIVGLGIGYLAVTLAGWQMAYPLEWIGGAILLGIAVGIVSGIYPAWRAATLDPVETVRRE